MDEIDLVPFASADYWILLGVVFFGRGMDFLSTWAATPHLVLEGNPIAKWMGWRLGIVVNIALSLGFALSLITTIVVVTMSLLVAARNFQSAWMMRCMGEFAYQSFMSDLLAQRGVTGYLVTTYAQSALTAIVGLALILFSANLVVPVSIGIGTLAYSLAVVIFTTIGVWRRSRHH